VPSRRDALRRIGALGALGAAALAGCTGSRWTDDAPGTATPTGRRGTTAGTRETVRFEHRDPSSLPASSPPVRVYSPSLRRLLDRAATADGPIRDTCGTYAPAPRPVLPTLGAVELTDVGEADGTYAVDARAGTYYELLAGAERVDPPAGATVRDAATLPPERRAFVRGVVTDSVRVEPQTALGEFVCTAFFGGYWRVDGTVYRGHEVQQTDAAFFSERAWYVLELTPADRPAPTLALDPVPDAVHGALDETLAGHRSGDVSHAGPDIPEAVLRFARETDRLLLHDALLAVEVVA
jgi:hypothetical protein